MKYDGVVVKFGELFLKGKNRYRFIDRVLQTIKNKTTDLEDLSFEKFNDHITIKLNGVEDSTVVERLNFVFGLYSYQLVKFCKGEIEDIKKTTLEVVKEMENDGKSIKVVTKRSNKRFPHTSMEISQQVGIFVAENSSVPIDLDNPDIKIKVSIKDTYTFVVGKEFRALGGLPIGLNGKSLLMLSGGLDSPVAAYLMMKRGIAVEGLHFESPPHTSPKARQKVLDLAEKMAHYMPNGKFTTYMVPFTKLQKAIFDSTPASYGMTIMRRMMYRISEGVARKTGSLILSNGESLGQVASQTPQSMYAINEVTTMPVIRPVSNMDKVDIMDIARKIDTYDISIRPFEDCCTLFVPKNPATSPKLEKCIEYEKKFEWQELIDECIAGTVKQVVHAGKTLIVDEETTDEVCELL
jgi:thiamine biosynthesis protein ThiI